MYKKAQLFLFKGYTSIRKRKIFFFKIDVLMNQKKKIKTRTSNKEQFNIFFSAF